MKTSRGLESIPSTDAEIVAVGRRVLRMEGRAVSRLARSLGSEFAEAVRRLAACRGRVLVSGVGKSGVVGKKLAGTLTSVGIPALFLHPIEALHGDLGLVTSDDIAIFLSYSGETPELLRSSSGSAVWVFRRLPLRVSRTPHWLATVRSS